MYKYWIPLLLTMSLWGCSASQSEVPVEVSVNEMDDVDAYSQLRSTVVIRAVTDSVQINKVTVNRGNNCKVVFWHQQWPGAGSLKFGQSVTGEDSCDMDTIKEVEVETDKGSYTLSF
jgi:hypothetical protein